MPRGLTASSRLAAGSPGSLVGGVNPTGLDSTLHSSPLAGVASRPWRSCPGLGLVPFSQASHTAASRPTQQQYDLIHSFCHPPIGLTSCTHRRTADWPFTPFGEGQPAAGSGPLCLRPLTGSPGFGQETGSPLGGWPLRVTSPSLDCRASGNEVHASMQNSKSGSYHEQPKSTE